MKAGVSNNEKFLPECVGLYRFGVNGKPYDNELYGSKNNYDYGMRFYNPRLGRFMSMDTFI